MIRALLFIIHLPLIIIPVVVISNIVVIASAINNNNNNDYYSDAHETKDSPAELPWKTIHTFERENFVHAVSYSFDGIHIAVGGADKQLAIYDTESGDLIHTIVCEGRIFSVSFSRTPTNELLAVGGDDNKVTVYSVNDWSVKHIFLRNRTVESIVFSHYGNMMAFGDDDNITIIYGVLDSGEPEQFNIGGTIHGWGAVNSLSFAPNGSYIAIGTNTQVVRIYDIVSDKVEHKITLKDPTIVTCVSYSFDGSQLAVGSIDELIIYESFTFDRIRTIKLESNIFDEKWTFPIVRSISWSIDGKKLVVGELCLSHDRRKYGMTTVVDVATGEQILSFESEDEVSSVTFHPNGLSMAIGGYDKKAVLIGSSIIRTVDSTLDDFNRIKMYTLI